MRALVIAALLFSSIAPASAQERYRRPFEGAHRMNYGFDHAGGGGCDDYECGGACYDTHNGSDFGTPFGTDVLAGADGTVSFAMEGCADYGYVGNPCGSYCGNYVRVDHSDGSRTIYCHMRRGSLRVRTGDRVRCGQLLGQSASSGSSSGPHLHFGYRPTTGSAYRDPFHGACSSAASRWVMQRGYREPPGTACSCVPATEVCNGRDDDCDGASDEEEVCEIDLLIAEASSYAPTRSSDIDGDRRADVCARDASGVHCWLARADGWMESPSLVALADADGWEDPSNRATLRMGDVNGDRRADLCARADAGVLCAVSEGEALGELTPWQAELSDENGWASPRHYTTLRLADVDADGRDDLCARHSMGFSCWISDGTTFARRVDGPSWSDEAGFDRTSTYGTIRMGDVDGDGRADVCARTAAQIECWLSDGDGFPTRVAGPAWSDDRGWSATRYWSTLRLADVDGDGRADLCARNSVDLRCLASRDAPFDHAIVVAALADTGGWDDVSNYATIRAGDVDGDGAEDLCARTDASVVCWAVHGERIEEIAGPAWSDDLGWSAPQHYETMRLADVDGDGTAEPCARAAAGWSCAGQDLGALEALDAMRDDQGFGDARYWSSILAGGPACVRAAETCDGRDEDCDGVVDEGACESADASAAPRPDGGTEEEEEPMVTAGCTCSALSPHTAPSAWWSAIAILGWLVLRRRRSLRIAAMLALLFVAGCATSAFVAPLDAQSGPTDGGAADAAPADAPIEPDAGPACRGATQPCASDEGCCGDLVCGSNMLGQVCCGNEGGTCASSADCCGDMACMGDRCVPMCRPAVQPCTEDGQCCGGLTCGTTTAGRVCCGGALTPCSTSDGSDCCGDLACGTTSAGRVCCGSSGASCSTSDGRDCCGSLLCVSGRCQ